ncbi:MAG: DUF4389 domain-containing protein [Actinobacteria bacterium]|jgi:uncharacterized membrane protein|nr:DUF4389 domain-containing protein [Actinomycetota bacterium]MDA8185792.1 DUF4389 domain-containing protein [Actinomycetota bacterium]
MTAPGSYPAATEQHPVQVSIQRSAQMSRVLALFSIPFFIGRFVLLVPVLIVLYVLSIVLAFVAWIGQWAVLFTGAYPEGMHRFLSGIVRLNTRAMAYLYGLTNTYPGFSLDA